MTHDSKQYDFILLGATSFVGKIIIRHITNNKVCDRDFTWAVAARSKDKLAVVLDPIEQSQRPDMLIANTHDESSIDVLCQKTSVILSTIGPYAAYGEKVIAACVNSGTSYCDLSGEAHWIAEMIHKYESKAQQTGARIVCATGFDSIPSDLGVKYLQTSSQEKFGAPCTHVTLGVKAMKGGLSGGTIGSLLGTIEAAIKTPSLRKVLTNPYAQCPKNHTFTERQPSVKGRKFSHLFDVWLAPFLMEPVNTRVVHRSNALQDNAYGDKFCYQEGTLFGKGLSAALKAQLYTIAYHSFFICLMIKPTRHVLAKYVLPKPGEGPSRAQQDNGFYVLHIKGETDAKEVISVKVSGDADPGYGSTAKIITQAALSLAFDIPTDKAGGFWTPATLFDDAFLERLEKYAGLTFKRL